MTSKQKNYHKALTTSAILLGSALAVHTASQEMHQVQAKDYQYTNLASHQVNFLNKITGHAQELASQNDLYASVMIAQAVLESGWGSSQLSQAPYNNLFGIKGAYKGQTANFKTLEDDGSGNYYAIVDGFRQYPSYRESLIDYVGVLKNGPSFNANYYAGAWKSNTKSYQDATAWLTGRYATDTSYGRKLNSIIQANQLTRFDVPGVTLTSNSKSASAGQKSHGEKTYTVQAGDGLYTVAQELGTSVSELKARYGLTSDLIHPGQVFSAATSQAGQVKQASQAKSNKTYTVQAGDGLYTVAQELGTSVNELKARYGLTSNLIHPGQVFSTSGSQIETSSQVKEVGQSEPTKTYTVQAGDGLYTVAQELGTSVSELKARYGLTSNLIHPGQVFASSGSQIETSSQVKEVGQSEPTKTYTVQAGDGLYTVAQELGTSVSELKARYGLTSNLIHPGQVFTSGSQLTSQPTSQTSQATGSAYTVQPGDTLWKIARQNGLTVDQLKAMNGLESDQIYLGQALNFTGQPVASQPSQANSGHVSQPEVSKPVPEQPASHTISQPASNQGQQSYTIQAGDNLYRIAQNNGISLDALVAANGFENEQALILPGQAITIPQ